MKRELQNCLTAMFLGLHDSRRQSSRWKLQESQLQLNGYGRQNHVQVLIHGACEYVTWIRRMKVADQQIGRISWSEWAQHKIARFLKSGRVRHKRSIEMTAGSVMLALKREEGAKRQGMWVASRSWKRQGKRSFPRASRKEHSSAHNTLVLASWDPCQMSDLRKYKTVNW